MKKRKLYKLIEDLVDHIEGTICPHESLNRGGSIWTICEDCGMKWADDKGGFHTGEPPTVLTRAHEVLESRKV